MGIAAVKITTMQIQLTDPMKRAMTLALMRKIERALEEFPELEDHTLKVGLVTNSRVHGNADSRNTIIRLNTREKIRNDLLHHCARTDPSAADPRIRYGPER